MRKVKDLINKEFDRLTVLEKAGVTSSGAYKWKCSCRCGNIIEVVGSDLRRGHTTSCGCYKKENTSLFNRTHGDARTPEYGAWKNMIIRCEERSSYKDRGISVCEEWKTNYLSFLLHVGRKPKGTSLDRIDNNKGYEPGNVRWATSKTQARNTSKNVLYTINNVTKCIAEWCEVLGKYYPKVMTRIYRGWSIEEALEIK